MSSSESTYKMVVFIFPPPNVLGFTFRSCKEVSSYTAAHFNCVTFTKTFKKTIVLCKLFMRSFFFVLVTIKLITLSSSISSDVFVTLLKGIHWISL